MCGAMWHAPHTPTPPGYLRYAGQMLRIALTADQQKYCAAYATHSRAGAGA